LQRRCSTAWATPPVYFALVILEIGSHQLFAQADLEPRSSWSQRPRCLGLQSWASGARPPHPSSVPTCSPIKSHGLSSLSLYSCGDRLHI
jgi:hypothetical protein